jgi:predicted transcriptional regulator
MSAITIRIPSDLEKQLDEEVRLEKAPRSKVIRRALAEFLKRQAQRRYLGEMAHEARSQSPEDRAYSLQVAEEALPFDNEAAGEYDEKKWWK